MNIVKAKEGVPYQAAGHHGGVYLSLQNDKVPGNEHLTVNLSHFDPGGGCDMSTIPAGMNLCYYLLKGQLTFTVKGGETFTLHEGDSVLWAAGDERGFTNYGDTVADLLVIIAK